MIKSISYLILFVPFIFGCATSTTNDINRFTETIQTIHGCNINLLINRSLRELNKIFEEINI